MDLVSIIIPCFNSEAFLGEAVDSALDQSYRAIEVIAIDDGSTDGTADILRSYGNRIRVVRQSNAGTGAACNTGVSAATGRWIAFLDADDVWEPQKLEIQIGTCGQFWLSHTNSWCFGSGISEPVLRSSFETMSAGHVLSQVSVRNFITKSSVLVTRDAFLSAGGFDGRFPAVEDWPLWIRLCAKHEIGYVATPLVRYRVHAASKSMRARETLAEHLRIIDHTFSASGPASHLAALKRLALESSYEINGHFAASSRDWSLAFLCAFHAVILNPRKAAHWKFGARSILSALNVGA